MAMDVTHPKSATMVSSRIRGQSALSLIPGSRTASKSRPRMSGAYSSEIESSSDSAHAGMMQAEALPCASSDGTAGAAESDLAAAVSWRCCLQRSARKASGGKSAGAASAPTGAARYSQTTKQAIGRAARAERHEWSGTSGRAEKPSGAG
eukprot:scaffold223941_cov37-Tisochrysis_lutea.AAC.1